jgi:hypothetical protein
LAQDVAPGTDVDADPFAVLDALAALVDKALVSVDTGEPARYRLLESVRVFALERLAAAGEVESCRDRHARAVARLFAESDESAHGDGAPAGRRPTASEFVRTLQPEIDNARAALERAVATEDWATAITLGGAAAALFWHLGLVRELLPTLRALRPHLDAAPVSAQVNLLQRLGSFGVLDGMSHDELLVLKTEAVARARAAGLRKRLHACLAALGFTLARVGDLAGAETVAAELRMLENPDDPAAMRAVSLSVQLMIHQHREEIEDVVETLGRQRSLLLDASDQTLALLSCEANLVAFLNVLGRHDEAAEIGRALVGEVPGRTKDT